MSRKPVMEMGCLRVGRGVIGMVGWLDSHGRDGVN